MTVPKYILSIAMEQSHFIFSIKKIGFCIFLISYPLKTEKNLIGVLKKTEINSPL
jgi:hypothetical protein